MRTVQIYGERGYIVTLVMGLAWSNKELLLVRKKKNFKVKTEIVETSDLTNITGERGRSYTETKT